MRVIIVIQFGLFSYRFLTFFSFIGHFLQLTLTYPYKPHISPELKVNPGTPFENNGISIKYRRKNSCSFSRLVFGSLSL